MVPGVVISGREPPSARFGPSVAAVAGVADHVKFELLDYRAVEPGQAATAAVRKTVKDAGLDSAYDATVRLTGAVPLLDQQFATLQQGVGFNSAITGAIILIVLWLALRSVRIVLAIVITILAGLIVATALGLLLVGAFNPISVAFAVLFVGLGADFAIQFSVRFSR